MVCDDGFIQAQNKAYVEQGNGGWGVKNLGEVPKENTHTNKEMRY